MLETQTNMAKWFDEVVLIRYWEDRCTKYTRKDGAAVQSARRNPRFGGYPDISENFLSNGAVVPAEIEWLTTNFDRHGHDVSELLDHDGFLIVLKNDASFLVEQIEIDRADFIDWLGQNGSELAAETIAAVDRIATASKEPQIFLYYVRGGSRGKENFHLALEHGVWGFPESGSGRTRGWSSILEVKKGDIVVAIHDFKFDKSVAVKGGRVPRDMYLGTFRNIVGLVVTSKLYRNDVHRIWPNASYPNRFNFRTPPLFIGRDIPCSPKALGLGLHSTLHRIQLSGSMQKIDGSSMTKLMSLCTKHLV